MSNSTILAGVSTLVTQVVTDLATLASAIANVASIQTSLATAQAVVAADLADSTTSSSTLAARLPSEQALVSVLETQLAAANAAVVVSQATVYTDGLIAGTQCQSIARQWRSWQKSVDQTTLLNFVDPNKLRLGSTAIADVLAASASDTTIGGWYEQFSCGDAKLIPTRYPNIVNLSANWTAFQAAFASVEGLTLVSPA